ncbi:MAG: hypothetical protein HDS93_03945 [Bacteroidales bacterium]|nr:hypothetical protein [Bacteroidales bacterium]
MKPARKRIVRTCLMPKSYCLNLFGILFARDTSWIDDAVINHERIHDFQQRELLYVFFYLLYFFEWIVRLIQYRDLYLAYKNISFEREAYARGDDFSYLDSRPLYAWVGYLRRK